MKLTLYRSIVITVLTEKVDGARKHADKEDIETVVDEWLESLADVLDAAETDEDAASEVEITDVAIDHTTL